MAFTSFTNEFLNSPIQPTFQSSLNLDFSTLSSVTLEWVYVNPNTLYPFSQSVFASNTEDPSFIIFPDSTLASVGQTTIITNQGSGTLTIMYSDNDQIIETIDPSQSWVFILTDNSTTNGIWTSIQLGATTSEATAASLIDNSEDSNDHVNSGGLGAFSTFLKQNIIVNTFTSGSTYTQASGDRGTVLVWTAGTGTYQCQPADMFGEGYFFTIRNGSTGSLITVVPDPDDATQTINGSTVTFTLNPGDTCSFVSDGVDTIYSFASSIFQSNTVDLITIDLSTAVDDTITLTQDQASYAIQKYQNGTGSTPITIIYPNTSYNEWIAFNDSSTLTINVKLNGGTESYVIPPGNRLFVFSDTTELYNVPDFLGETIIYLQDGSDDDPSLTFSSAASTGLYLGGGDSLSISSNATLVADFSDTGNTSLVAFTFPVGSSTEPSITFEGNTSTGLYYDGTTPTLAGGSNTFGASYTDQNISIYSLMRAYG